jgi:hypothetical protein
VPRSPSLRPLPPTPTTRRAHRGRGTVAASPDARSTRRRASRAARPSRRARVRRTGGLPGRAGRGGRRARPARRRCRVSAAGCAPGSSRGHDRRQVAWSALSTRLTVGLATMFNRLVKAGALPFDALGLAIVQGQVLSSTRLDSRVCRGDPCICRWPAGFPRTRDTCSFFRTSGDSRTGDRCGTASVRACWCRRSRSGAARSCGTSRSGACGTGTSRSGS